MNERSFLFLQGPQSRFFRRLGLALLERGHRVHKINFCGGDVVHWPSPYTSWYQGTSSGWPAWLARFVDSHDVTDILLFGDRRPMHRDAIVLARARGVRHHVFEEGYLRPHFITMEEGGVNGMSNLPSTPDAVLKAAEGLPTATARPPLANPLSTRVHDAIRHHLGNSFLFGLFPLYRTHRPYPIAWELLGMLPRYLARKRRKRTALAREETLFQSGRPFFLFPLQLDTDIQVTLYSPFSGVRESIMEVMASFARNAPADCLLVIKNHPLDNGLIKYEKFCNSMAVALGLDGRVVFLDGGTNSRLMERCQGMTLINSTMGLEGLGMERPVYCLGQAIYRMEGLATGPGEMVLDAFWKDPRPVDMGLFKAFAALLRERCLVYGNFYSERGIETAVQACLERLGG